MSEDKVKNPYKVMFIENNKIIHATDWIMAESDETAQRLAIAKNPAAYHEEVRVLVSPFC